MKKEYELNSDYLESNKKVSLSPLYERDCFLLSPNMTITDFISLLFKNHKEEFKENTIKILITTEGVKKQP